MLSSPPETVHEFVELSWPEIEPYFTELAVFRLKHENVQEWLAGWSRLRELVEETRNRLSVATTLNTADEQAERRYHTFLQEIFERAEAADQTLKTGLLDSGLEPENFEVPLRNLRAEAALFREANLPLLTEERKLVTEHDKLVGAQTVEWEGREVTLPQLLPELQNPDREVRERVWRLAAGRQLADREAINVRWAKFLELRRQLAANADCPDFRTFRWRQLLRFEYSPADCARFQRAIEAEVVPAAARIYEKRRRRLGLEILRPWDLEVDSLGRPALRPYEAVAELEGRAAAIFRRVDPELGAHFDRMRAENLLDLDNRKNKAPGGYCTTFPRVRRPFIFMNAVGVHDDVQTLLHEAGHAFHVFETRRLPYLQQLEVGMEMAEVASMGMELLAAPYLPEEEGGYYTPGDAARARVQHLEGLLQFWPYMAVVDAFQHWVYENHEAAFEPSNCDAKWAELWQRFMIGVDWDGLEQEMRTGWQRKLHIHQDPLYYVEYGLAQLGAVQIWRNSLRNHARAVARYRRALSLGGTAPLPQLYRAAGARFAFDAQTLREAVSLIKGTIEDLEG